MLHIQHYLMESLISQRDLLEEHKEQNCFQRSEASLKTRKHSLSSYLRVLDARATGLSFEEIEKSLFIGQSKNDYRSDLINTKSEEQYEAAKKYCDYKYLL